ncbi:histidinol-phosphatase HisJ [Aliarcobacter cibarius]|jgi:histidinol-phosphatase (PHP family)|uniref:Histidinol-phosphatase n=1 Tax=Aliarcobacter cibarius TaxID=255507 RepID=A0A7L5JMV9_9BACT|nr:histidinol-phosphatase HisJ [Aliarcobacter cibarius]QKJ26497.1 histidinol-phosphate phosphatase [Aliarcobacter cibarius]TLS97314.1 histidinol-phosphatase HisJ [Aliarcobacter cibarius]TLS97871.1 histidinol-phosphatase HisJ [Aliarcobacter cibarius]TLT03313.1 histidinol-phosphatase HisJ [Aliarcobacter cibarius]
MVKKRVDLHNHTILCNHATGSVDEYIQRAIELGIDEYGFSCHAPMTYDPKYRMKIEEKAIYEKWINDAKGKYKDVIKVLLAYEVDYLNGYMLDEILNAKVDYLIGSVHFLQNKNEMWGFDNPEFIGVYASVDIDKVWEDYFFAIKSMAKTGYFDIAGHLDLIKVFRFLPKKDIRLIAKEALKEIKKSNMVIEINPAGLRKPIGETYPSRQILEEAYDLGINITFGSDAHSIEHIGFGYEESVSLVREIGYKSCVTFENRDRKLVDF